MWVSNDFVGLGIVAIILSSILLTAEIWLLKGGDPEVTRKFVQVFSRVTCLFLPYLIQSALVVFGISVFIFALFLYSSKSSSLPCIHGVSRHSFGTIYYPAAIFLIYFLSHDVPWLYVTSILVLALSDSAASLVGGRYGSIFYNIEDEQKSLEGSLIFLMMTFLAVQIPTLLMTDIPKLEVIMASLLVAVTVTGVEAISLEGLDNLYIPISACLVLERIMAKPFSEIVYQNFSLLGLLLIVTLAIWKLRAFNVGATILIALFLFGAWSLGSEVWVIPLMLMGIWYFTLWYFYRDYVHYKYTKVRRTAKALTIPFVLIFIANYTDEYAYWYTPYVAAITTLFMIIAYNFVRQDKHILKMPDYCRALLVSILSWAGIVLPTWYFGSYLSENALLSMLPVLITLCLYNSATPALPAQTLDRLNSKNTVYPLVAALFILLLQYFMVI